jgi:signal transduction histidine kinase
MSLFLVIEENPHRAEAMQLLLEFAAHECVVVQNSDEAMDYLQNEDQLDGIIANLIMQSMDGFHLARSIKLEEAWAQMPVILIAEANSIEGDASLAKRAGATTLARRPLQREQFLAEIDEALMKGPLQANPLTKNNPVEETSFLRDYNSWLSRMMYQSTRKLETTSGERDLAVANLYAIDTVTTALGASLDFNATMETLVEKTASLMRAQAAAIYIGGDEAFRLGHVGGFGIPTPALASDHDLHQDSPIAAIIAYDHAVLLDEADEITALREDFHLEIKLASAIASPLIAQGKLSGFLLTLRVDDDDPFTLQDAITLNSLAGAAGLALHSAQLFSELERAYEDLQELDRRRSEFVAITSHELRTPLAIMLGYTSLLHDVEEDPKRRAQLASIEKQAYFLTGMVDTLLNLRELSEDKEPILLRCANVQVDQLLHDALAVTLEHTGNDKEVTFEIDCDPVQIRGDDIRLLLVMNNLMDNAIKFSEPKGLVKVVGVQSPDGGAVITLEDQGGGIETEHMPHIFEPFYQAEPAITRQHGGMGLGLAIVRGLVDLHGGNVEVKTRPGAGSTFIVTLPAHPPEGRCQSL